MPSALLRRLLAHPLTTGMHVDDPATTERRKQIVASKPFLKAIDAERLSQDPTMQVIGSEMSWERGAAVGKALHSKPGWSIAD